MQLLIGYETGLIVLWDLREKLAEFRYNATEVSVENAAFTVSMNCYVCCLPNFSLYCVQLCCRTNSPAFTA